MYVWGGAEMQTEVEGIFGGTGDKDRKETRQTIKGPDCHTGFLWYVTEKVKFLGAEASHDRSFSFQT